jgi:two-component system, LytTR family, response regulator
MKIRAFIIDDEISAVISLRGLLEEYCKDVTVVGQAVSSSQATALLEQIKPDVVFLDIQMPPWGTGFDLLQTIPRRDFGVVFTTAFPNYALQAIHEVQPWGYLVKPIRLTELQVAVTAAQRHLERLPAWRKLVISDKRRGNIVIPMADILFCKAGGSTSDIYYQSEKGLLRVTSSRNLGDLEEEFSGLNFVRCHHSFIVNMSHIKDYRQTGRNGEITLPHNKKVPISVNKMSTFEEAFKTFVG